MTRTARQNIENAEKLIEALRRTAGQYGYRVEKPSIQGPSAAVKVTFLKLPEDEPLTDRR